MTNSTIEQAILAYLADGQPRTLRQVQCGIDIVVLSQPFRNAIDALVAAGKVERINAGVVRMKEGER